MEIDRRLNDNANERLVGASEAEPDAYNPMLHALTPPRGAGAVVGGAGPGRASQTSGEVLVSGVNSMYHVSGGGNGRRTLHDEITVKS